MDGQGGSGVNCIFKEEHEKVLDEIKTTLKDHEKRIGNIERNNATTTEQIKTIFRYLEDIKASLNTFATDSKTSINLLAVKVDNITNKPGNLAVQLIGAVAIAVVTAFVVKNLNLK